MLKIEILKLINRLIKLLNKLYIYLPIKDN